MIVNGKSLQVNETEMELEYTIQKYIEYDNQVIILMYDEAVIANNVLCFDKQGKELWKINDILNITRPTGNHDIIKECDNILAVYSVLGVVYKIDIEKKMLIEKIYLR